MTNPQDFTNMLQDALKNLPLDNKALQDAFKSSAAMGETMSKVALEAAEKSAEVSSKWTKDTLTKIGDLSAAKTAPEDGNEALKSFAESSAQQASQNLAAFAEIAQQVQKETLDLLMSAGKEFGAEASEAVKKATDAAKNAATPAKK